MNSQAKATLCIVRPSSYRPRYFTARARGFTTGGSSIDEAKKNAMDGYSGALKFRVLESPEIQTPYSEE